MVPLKRCRRSGTGCGRSRQLRFHSLRRLSWARWWHSNRCGVVGDLGRRIDRVPGCHSRPHTGFEQAAIPAIAIAAIVSISGGTGARCCSASRSVRSPQRHQACRSGMQRSAWVAMVIVMSGWTTQILQ